MGLLLLIFGLFAIYLGMDTLDHVVVTWGYVAAMAGLIAWMVG